MFHPRVYDEMSDVHFGLYVHLEATSSHVRDHIKEIKIIRSKRFGLDHATQGHDRDGSRIIGNRLLSFAMLQKAKYIVPNMNTLRSVEIEEVSWFAHRLKSIILTSPFVSCTGTGARHKLACILFDHNTHSPINLAQYLPHYHWTSDKRLIHTEMKSIAHQALNLWSTPASSRFSFPAWAADDWDDKILSKFGPSAIIYHASGNLPEVRTMAVFREPTNISMDRLGSRR